MMPLLLVSGLSYGKCELQSALDSLQDYYTDHIDSRRFDEYVDPTFLRGIRYESIEGIGESYVFEEKTSKVFEGVESCAILGIRYSCPSGKIDHEFKSCPEIK